MSTPEQMDWVNEYLDDVSKHEKTLVDFCTAQHSVGSFNDRWIAIARTHFEQGCMALERAAKGVLDES